MLPPQAVEYKLLNHLQSIHVVFPSHELLVSLMQDYLHTDENLLKQGIEKLSAVYLSVAYLISFHCFMKKHCYSGVPGERSF